MPQLNIPQPPRLVTAPQDYEAQYHNQNNDVLRLYFNQLNNAVSAVAGVRGTQFLSAPYAAIQRTTNRTFVANTATEITFNQNDFLNGCENDGTNGIRVSQSGIYNYQFSVQFANTNTTAQTSWIWLRVNAVDAPGTGSQFSVPAKHGAIDGHLIAAANFYVQLIEGDYVKMFAAADSTTVFMEAVAARTSPFAMPAIPSVVATLSFVSNLTA